MRRWPALARRASRPSPLLGDVALALVLAALSILAVEDVRPVAGTEVGHAGIALSPAPHGLGPGDPWDVEITVVGPEAPLARGEPRLVILNKRTGESTIYEARPTGEPGVYRIRAVFPDEGVYYYETLGGFHRTVTIGDPGAAAPSPSPGQTPVGAGSERDTFPVWPVALTLLATLPLAVRRISPIPVFVVTLGATLGLDFVYHYFQPFGALVAVYTVAAHVGRPRSIGIGVATALALTVFVAGGSDEGRVEKVAIYAIFGAAWLLGDNLRTRRAYLREVEARAVRLEREREADARRAAAEEQARIARELHDIIAHNVSVMTVQAAAAGDAFETQPARVREALASIESSGREALTELRRLLGSVRPGDGLGTFEPQPGLTRLDDLIDQVRATGIEVALTVEGSPRELPPGIDLSAYRIVQEALTNTLKHAEASHASVLVRYGDGTLDVEVVDDGRGATVEGAERGHGIIGMRERAALVGGELEVGRAANGGFSIHARIPLEEPEP